MKEGAGAGSGALGAALGAALAFRFDFFAALFFATTRFFFGPARLFFPPSAFWSSISPSSPSLPLIASRSLRLRYSLRRRDGRCRHAGPPFPGERLGFGASGRPVDQLDGVDHRDHGARSDLHHAAEIAGGDHIGLELFDIPDFTRAQPPRKLRLENVVGAGRTAAQMSFRYIFHHETDLAKQFFRRVRNFL